mmetsp:Transcript_55043/g.63533  ORF Transcript_55043/g.63533 Transcript_55043/m.63533 type:complete len:86 (-) Transcript_55043:9-266(-)
MNVRDLDLDGCTPLFIHSACMLYKCTIAPNFQNSDSIQCHVSHARMVLLGDDRTEKFHVMSFPNDDASNDEHVVSDPKRIYYNVW